MNVSRVVIVALILIGLGACTTKKYQDQRGPKCLGPICLERSKQYIDAEPFFEKYGVGLERKGKFPAYWYMDDGVFVYISRYHGENRPIEGIVVSKYPCYSKLALPPKQSFGSLVTEKGVELGATLEQVVGVYGQPNQLYTSAQGLKGQLPETWSSVNPKDITIARYENTYAEDDYGPWSLFFFEKDVLIAMELSNAL